MASDPELGRRSRLIRSLLPLREMLPGSFVQRHRRCGRPNCRCADGDRLHAEALLSVLVDGKPKTFHIPAGLAEQVRNQVERHKRFRQIADEVLRLNLGRFLRQKEKQKEKR